jgi:multiple sugar transport system substrate-binding protein
MAISIGTLGRSIAVAVAAAALAACGGGSSGSSSSGSGGGTTQIELWHGYTQESPDSPAVELDSLKKLVAEFEKANPTIKVKMTYVNSDDALEKLTVALKGGKAPDVTYQYGTNIAQVATSSSAVDLTSRVAAPDVNWNDFPQGERDAFTVDGKVYGVPALVDNLAVVYNKDLFAAAGLKEPSADWTWGELVADGKALSDPGKKQFGLEWPIDGSETEVWKYIPMLWGAGGDILTPDNKKTAFASQAGATALAPLAQLAAAKALYLDSAPDSEKAEQLFNSGKIGMFVTGPWDLSFFTDVKYGVQVMPSVTAGGPHTSIAGPDAWVLIDNGSKRVEAGWKLMKFLVSPQAVLEDSLATGHLPTRSSVSAMPQFAPFDTQFPGVDLFVKNLANVTKARPAVAAYPQVSSALGEAVTSVVLGKATPEKALADAAATGDAALAGG